MFCFWSGFFAVPWVMLLVVWSVIVINSIPCVAAVHNANREQQEENVNQYANEVLEIEVSYLFLCSESLKLLSNRTVKIQRCTIWKCLLRIFLHRLGSNFIWSLQSVNWFSNSGGKKDLRSSFLNSIQKLNFSTVIILTSILLTRAFQEKEKKKEEKQYFDTDTVMKWKVEHSVSIIQKKK